MNGKLVSSLRCCAWRMLGGAQVVPPIEGIMSREDFERELLRQRARCDRAYSRFALISFALYGSDASRANSSLPLWNLAQAVHGRMRVSDAAGWLTSGTSIGLLLLDASQEDAQAVIASIEEAFRARCRDTIRVTPIPELICDVFMYPANERDEASCRVVERKPMTVSRIVPFNRPSTDCVTP